MSGGSHEYVCYRMEDELAGKMGDPEMNDLINDIMSQPIDWAPGLPLKGDTYETPFYKKD